jgi:hypothetical protein
MPDGCVRLLFIPAGRWWPALNSQHSGERKYQTIHSCWRCCTQWRKNENWTIGRRFLKQMLSLTGSKILLAKQLEWEVLRKSELEWTLVRPPAIMAYNSTICVSCPASAATFTSLWQPKKATADKALISTQLKSCTEAIHRLEYHYWCQLASLCNNYMPISAGHCG